MIAFLSGIAVSYFLSPLFIVSYVAFLVSAIFLIVCWPWSWGRILGFIGLFFMLGMWRFQVALPSNTTGSLIDYHGEELEFYGVVSAEPDRRLDHVRLTVKAMETGGGELLRGRTLISTELYPSYNYGDLLKINCFLKAPEKIISEEDGRVFAYDNYLARYGVYTLCRRPELKLIESGHGNPVITAILSVKGRFAVLLNKLLPEPEAALMNGILLGTRAGLPEDLLADFQTVGLTHIIAVSGFNVTIIAAIVLKLVLAAGVSRRRAFWIIGTALVVFAILTGLSGSVVRATIMGFLVLLAQKWGRASRMKNALALTAFVMCLVNPYILLFDAGFQLSFLSTVGIIYLTPLLSRFLKFLPESLAFRENVATTGAAIIFTTPLILYSFGRFSVIALTVNLLVLPIIPLAMLWGTITLIFGIIYLPLGQIIGWPAWLMLNYVVRISRLFSLLPWSNLVVAPFHWSLVVLAYIVLMMVIFPQPIVRIISRLRSK